MGIEGAGGIDKNASRLQIVPYVGNDATLKLPAVLHVLCAPFCNGLRILAEHSFA